MYVILIRPLVVLLFNEQQTYITIDKFPPDIPFIHWMKASLK